MPGQLDCFIFLFVVRIDQFPSGVNNTGESWGNALNFSSSLSQDDSGSNMLIVFPHYCLKYALLYLVVCNLAKYFYCRVECIRP